MNESKNLINNDWYEILYQREIKKKRALFTFRCFLYIMSELS